VLSIAKVPEYTFYVMWIAAGTVIVGKVSFKEILLLRAQSTILVREATGRSSLRRA
jgi:hypothetical protein